MSWRDEYNQDNKPIGGGQKKSRPLIPVGKHIARIYGVAFLGRVRKEYKGDEKIKDVMLIMAEFPAIKHIFDEEKGEQPLSMIMEIAIPYATDKFDGWKKSNLYQWWDKITDSEPISIKEFNSKAWDEWFADRTVQISVTHKKKEDGTYKEEFNPTSKEVEPIEESINTPFFYNIITNENDYWNMPQFIRDKIDGDDGSRRLTRGANPNPPEKKD